MLFFAESFLFSSTPKIFYDLSDDPIDVIIPCVKKDLYTLNFCIEGIQKNGKNIRRIIVLSNEPLTDKAEWFDEKNYPFSFDEVGRTLYKGTESWNKYRHYPNNRVGWFYQQLLKLYAPFVIPDISSNILILDADTIFVNPVEFLTLANGGLFNPGSEYHAPYFSHAKKLIPWLHRVHPSLSGISHHMLFQRSVLEDLFDTIYFYHHQEPWIAFLECVDTAELVRCTEKKLFYSGASEYEIYFNFALIRSNQIQIRPLKWENLGRFDSIEHYKNKGLHYFSSHDYLR